jgi:hypothetical protein
MANKRLTQLPVTTAATNANVLYIVDNYVAGLVQKVRDVENHQEVIDGLIKQINREETINQIFEENKDELL